MSVQRLGYLGFEVSDVPAWRSFMTEKLGAMEATGNEYSARFRTDSRSWRLLVEKGPSDDISFAGFEVDSEEALFAIGKILIGLYIGKSSIVSGFGAAGSLAVVLVWVYYSAQIFLLGAEFTRSYAHKFGSRRNLLSEDTAAAARPPRQLAIPCLSPAER